LIERRNQDLTLLEFDRGCRRGRDCAQIFAHPRTSKNLAGSRWPCSKPKNGVRKNDVGYNHRQPMSPTTVYKVTIQATAVGTDQWKVVASGTWTPGQPPQLEQTLSAEVIEALFDVSPSENSGRNQVELGAMLSHRARG
jgi:hypothetical protein